MSHDRLLEPAPLQPSEGRPMTPYYADESVTLYAGDCVEVLRALPESSVDAVVTDPPYGLEFMGKEWDAPWKEVKWDKRGQGAERGFVGKARAPVGGFSEYRAGAPFQSWCEQWAAECLRVLKPGGHMLSFGGTRTSHRLTCGIEDAGFEIRDSITWIYGSGFPKSLDVSKAIDKAAGAERQVVGRYELPDVADGRRASGWNCTNTTVPGVFGVSGQCTITVPATSDAERWRGWGTALKPASEPIAVARKPLRGTVAQNVQQWGTGALNIDGCRVEGVVQAGAGSTATFHGGPDNYVPGTGREYTSAGRWPPNVALTHAADCADRCGSSCPVAELDRQSGSSPAKGGTTAGWQDEYVGGTYTPIPKSSYVDTGGASRFFPTFRYEAKAPTSERPRDGLVAHPTIKPLDLMRWLVRLVTPPGGLVLDPFAGSGTTAEACVVEGFRCIAIEREPTYLPLIVKRLSKPIQADMFGGVA